MLELELVIAAWVVCVGTFWPRVGVFMVLNILLFLWGISYLFA